MKRKAIVLSILMSSMLTANSYAVTVWPTGVVEKLPDFVELPENAMRGYAFAADVHLLKSNKLKLPLPEGDELSLKGRLRTKYANGSKLWVGFAESDPFSSVLLTQHGKAIAGVIRFKDRVFKVKQVDEHQHMLIEVPPNEPMPEADPVQPDTSGSSSSSSTSSDGSASSQIDIMVAYSTDTKINYGGVDGVNAHIALAIAESNQAYANSQIDAQLRLVHTVEVENTSGNMSNDLSALQSTTDGKLDEIHSLRDQYGADMVSWFNEQSGYCGIAYVNKGDISQDAAWGFSVVNSGCATGYFSTAHELGHNMGSMHDEANSSSQGIYPYSYGYQEPSGDFRTVMAYNCPEPGCVREQFFSNPDLAFNGSPIGTIDANNALSINQTRDAVSQWRPEVVDTPPNVNFSYNCNLLDCTFNDTSTSFSPLTNWDWDFGDESGSSTDQNPSYTFSSAGSYNVQLIVTDETGASAIQLETVVVSDTQPIPPEQPQAPLVTVSGADVSIDWTTDEAASHYSLERYKQHPKNGKWTSGTTIVNVTPSYVDQPGDGTFRYRLIAHNAHGASAPSQWVNAEGVSSGGSSGGGKGNKGKGGRNR